MYEKTTRRKAKTQSDEIRCELIWRTGEMKYAGGNEAKKSAGRISKILRRVTKILLDFQS